MPASQQFCLLFYLRQKVQKLSIGFLQSLALSHVYENKRFSIQVLACSYNRIILGCYKEDKFLFKYTYFNAINGNMYGVQTNCSWCPVSTVSTIVVHSYQHVLTWSRKKKRIWESRHITTISRLLIQVLWVLRKSSTISLFFRNQKLRVIKQSLPYPHYFTCQHHPNILCISTLLPSFFAFPHLDILQVCTFFLKFSARVLLAEENLGVASTHNGEV